MRGMVHYAHPASVHYVRAIFAAGAAGALAPTQITDRQRAHMLQQQQQLLEQQQQVQLVRVFRSSWFLLVAVMALLYVGFALCCCCSVAAAAVAAVVGVVLYLFIRVWLFSVIAFASAVFPLSGGSFPPLVYVCGGVRTSSGPVFVTPPPSLRKNPTCSVPPL